MATESIPKARKRGRGADSDETKQLLLDAAFAVVSDHGFSAATARAIATAAGCNQAAIYYHFGGIEPLLGETLRQSSARRLERYRAVLAEPIGLVELFGELQKLYAEDRASGHLSLLAEFVSGVSAKPELKEDVVNSTAEWLDFVEDQITTAAEEVAFGSMIPAADLADMVFSLIVGIELRSKVDGRDDRPNRLFALAGLAATLVTSSQGNSSVDQRSFVDE